jgi:hypothetical protein
MHDPDIGTTLAKLPGLVVLCPLHPVHKLSDRDSKEVGKAESKS